MNIVILPIEQVSIDVLMFIKQGLSGAFPDVEATISEACMPLPHEAYDSSRRQYYSTLILAGMSSRLRMGESEYVLGVTEVDLYVPTLNFVFGEAQLSGRVAVISLFRLKPEFYRERPDRQLFHERALKEAVHEIGHTLGLEHCRHPTCIMHFSNSILDTDRKRAAFCEKCSAHVLEALRTEG